MNFSCRLQHNCNALDKYIYISSADAMLINRIDLNKTIKLKIDNGSYFEYVDYFHNEFLNLNSDLIAIPIQRNLSKCFNFNQDSIVTLVDIFSYTYSTYRERFCCFIKRIFFYICKQAHKLIKQLIKLINQIKCKLKLFIKYIYCKLHNIFIWLMQTVKKIFWFVVDVIDSIIDLILNIICWFWGTVKNIYNFIIDRILITIYKELVTRIIPAIVNKIFKILKTLLNSFDIHFSDILEIIYSIITLVLIGLGMLIFSAVSSGSSVIGDVIGTGGDLISRSVEGIAGGIGDIAGGIGNTLKGLTDGIGNTLGGITGGIGNAIGGLFGGGGQ